MKKAKEEKKASKEQDVKDSEYINRCATLIEKTLEAHGIFAKVRNICILDDFYEYQMDVAVGTDLDKLETLDRDLALCLASSTGKVDWRIPIPGKALIGLRVPKPPPEYFQGIENEFQRRLKENSLRNKVAFMFYLLGQVNYHIANKILGKPVFEK